MRFDEKLKKYSREQLWQEYCGYLDMTLAEYMYTQRRLMEEQIRLWSACPLGRQLLAGKHPETLEDFLAQLPLTSYLSDIAMGIAGGGIAGAIFGSRG